MWISEYVCKCVYVSVTEGVCHFVYLCTGQCVSVCIGCRCESVCQCVSWSGFSMSMRLSDRISVRGLNVSV